MTHYPNQTDYKIHLSCSNEKLKNDWFTHYVHCFFFSKLIRFRLGIVLSLDFLDVNK